MAFVKEYNTVQEAVQAADRLHAEAAGEVFVLAYDKKVMNEVAGQSDAEKIGIDDIGVGPTLKMVFRGKSEVLRIKLTEAGLSLNEAEVYEEKLKKGKILVISKTKSSSI